MLDLLPSQRSLRVFLSPLSNNTVESQLLIFDGGEEVRGGEAEAANRL